MLRHSWVVVAVAFVGCGLDLTVSDSGGPSASSVDASATDSARPSADAAEPGDASVEDASVVDASQDASTDATLDPTKVDIAYAAGRNGKMYSLRLGGMLVEEPSGGCPQAQETAVMSDGTVWITSLDNHDLYTWSAASGCKKAVRADTGKYDLPLALGVAPKGTLSAGGEELVGYFGSDYLRIDRTTLAVSTVMTNALGGYMVRGDVVAMGRDGYVTVAGGTGPAGALCSGGADCILPVNLVDGTPTGPPIPVQCYVEGLAHGGGALLLFCGDQQVRPFYPSTRSIGPSLAQSPPGVSFGGAGSRPFPGN
jgi:hypothetical protein